jgi:hypothetical protein
MISERVREEGEEERGGVSPPTRHPVVMFFDATINTHIEKSKARHQCLCLCKVKGWPILGFLNDPYVSERKNERERTEEGPAVMISCSYPVFHPSGYIKMPR